MAPFDVLYGKACKTPIYWDEIGERKLIGPELVQMTTEAIQTIKSRLQTA